MLLMLPLSSREGKGLESTAASLLGPEASAKGREIRSREILIDSPPSSVGLRPCILLFNSNKQALMKGFEALL